MHPTPKRCRSSDYLSLVDGYSQEDFRIAIEAFPQEGLQESAQALSQALEGAGEQREDYWRNRIQPFWQNIWPKSRDLATSGIAESLARLSIAAGNNFPIALTAVQDWLRPVEHPYYVVHQLHQANLCTRFPLDSLRLLNAMVDGQQWPDMDLRRCLNAIAHAAPELTQDVRYQRLDEYLRQRGM